jgi:hypothetical protein
MRRYQSLTKQERTTIMARVSRIGQSVCLLLYASVIKQKSNSWPTHREERKNENKKKNMKK